MCNHHRGARFGQDGEGDPGVRLRQGEAPLRRRPLGGLQQLPHSSPVLRGFSGCRGLVGRLVLGPVPAGECSLAFFHVAPKACVSVCLFRFGFGFGSVSQLRVCYSCMVQCRSQPTRPAFLLSCLLSLSRVSRVVRPLPALNARCVGAGGGVEGVVAEEMRATRPITQQLKRPPQQPRKK